MLRRVFLLACGGSIVWLAASVALAGMPAVTLTDIPRVLTLSNLARMRLDAISFFVVGLLACGWIVQRLWNSLRRDFPRLPRLSFLRAQALIGLWGLLFLLVLTMISGARELMTPGAWKKNGLTYQLADTPPKDESHPAGGVAEGQPSGEVP